MPIDVHEALRHLDCPAAPLVGQQIPDTPATGDTEPPQCLVGRDAPQGKQHGPGVGAPDTNSSPTAPVDPSRVESARRTVLYRAPEGAPTGTLAPSAPLRVLGRSGDWTRTAEASPA